MIATEFFARGTLRLYLINAYESMLGKPHRQAIKPRQMSHFCFMIARVSFKNNAALQVVKQRFLNLEWRPKTGSPTFYVSIKDLISIYKNIYKCCKETNTFT